MYAEKNDIKINVFCSFAYLTPNYTILFTLEELRRKTDKGNYKVLVAVAGGDTNKEVQRAIFNGADIVVAWKNFYQAGAQTAELAEAFLKEIK